ncbi:hypothetical protein D9M72_153620 [compost metagenome]
MVSTYLAIPLFLALWIGHRLVRKSRWIRYADMRFDGVELGREAGAQAVSPVAADTRA